MPPAGEKAASAMPTTTDLNIWNRQTKLGVVLTPRVDLVFPRVAISSPDILGKARALECFDK